ncbi:MAG: hypothetical protein AABZ12_10645 [Planctomycetota bacterium]
MADETDNLLSLLERLDTRAPRPGAADAIDAIVDAPPRTTAVVSLRDHETVRRFRQELSDGLIRADTANQLLRLVRTVLEARRP